MRPSRKYDADIAFKDMLFNIILVLGILFVTLLFFINPPTTSNKNVEAKGEYIIQMDWDNESMSDFDLWVRDPYNNIVSFLNKSAGLMYLDIDDLGGITDTLSLPDGTTQVILLNREIVTLRGIVPGDYTVNVHFYNKKDSRPKTTIKVQLIRINPKYELITQKELLFDTSLPSGTEKTAFSFTLDSAGNVKNLNDLQRNFIYRK